MSYQIFFNLDDAPFRLTPDPAYFFPSKRHNEALETLVYSVETGEGFVQITGEPGVGKTLLIRSFLDQLGEHVNTALILHPRLGAEELFKVILEDLGFAPENMEDMSKESLLRFFRNILLQAAQEGRKTLVIIDEAQEIPEETLEELRLLSNLETEKTKLLQIILVGQRELEEKLSRDSLKQLKQRITIRYCLDCLTCDETVNYIQHRLKVAGSGNISRFSPEIIKTIHAASNGTPRLINSICERALMAAFVDGKSSVNQEHLDSALQSLDQGGSPTATRIPVQRSRILYAATGVFCVATALFYTSDPFQQLVQEKTWQTVSFVQERSSRFLKRKTVPNTTVATEKPEQQDRIESKQNDPQRSAPTGTPAESLAQPVSEQDPYREGRLAAPVSVEQKTEIPTPSPQQTATGSAEAHAGQQPAAPKAPSLKEAVATVPAQAETPAADAEGVELPEQQENSSAREAPQQPPVAQEQVMADAQMENSDNNDISTPLATGSFDNLMLLPSGWKSILISRRDNKAILLQGGDPVTAVRTVELPSPTELEEGIYLLSKEKDTPYLFNHRAMYSWQVDRNLATWLWQQFGEDTVPALFPVLVTATAVTQHSEQIALSTIQTMVDNWAQALNREDVAALLPFYDDSLLTYRLFRNTPTVKSHAEVQTQKQEVFEKNNAISLQISDPVCVINSKDPSLAMAIFSQRFISSNYSDSGIKILYIRKTGSMTPDKPQWVINGRLWLAAEKKTP